MFRFPRRLVGRLLVACSIIIALSHPNDAGYAAETSSLKVYGEDRPALQQGIRYWNDLAGKELLYYAGERAGEADPSTVTVRIWDTDEHTAGWAQGLVGVTPISITIRFTYAGNWVVYAHELGHALGFDDYDIGSDTSPYDGIMSHVSMWIHPNGEADRALLEQRHHLGRGVTPERLSLLDAGPFVSPDQGPKSFVGGDPLISGSCARLGCPTSR